MIQEKTKRIEVSASGLHSVNKIAISSEMLTEYTLFFLNSGIVSVRVQCNRTENNARYFNRNSARYFRQKWV